MLARERLRGDRARSATLDPLTGLLSNDPFFDALSLASLRVAESHRPWSLLRVELDHFQAIVDIYGAIAGDRVLRHFAGLLVRVAGERDIAARLDGATFAILLPDSSLTAARIVAMRLSALVRRAPCPAEPDAIHYTASMGVVESQGEGPQALFHLAGMAIEDSRRDSNRVHRPGAKTRSSNGRAGREEDSTIIDTPKAIGT